MGSGVHQFINELHTFCASLKFNRRDTEGTEFFLLEGKWGKTARKREILVPSHTRPLAHSNSSLRFPRFCSGFLFRCFDLIRDKVRYWDGSQSFAGVADAARRRQLAMSDFYIVLHKNKVIGERFGPFSANRQADLQFIFKFDRLEILARG